jgi:hypothetical protein
LARRLASAGLALAPPVRRAPMLRQKRLRLRRGQLVTWPLLAKAPDSWVALEPQAQA